MKIKWLTSGGGLPIRRNICLFAFFLAALRFLEPCFFEAIMASLVVSTAGAVPIIVSH